MRKFENMYQFQLYRINVAKEDKTYVNYYLLNLDSGFYEMIEPRIKNKDAYRHLWLIAQSISAEDFSEVVKDLREKNKKGVK